MSVSTSSRKAVTEALCKTFSRSQAESYEVLIFNMCKKLAEEEFDESIVDIYKYYAYEKVGQLMTFSPKEVIQDVKSGRIGEDAYYRKELKNKEPKLEGPLIRAGVFPCLNRKCRSYHTKETVFTSQQRRSSDEGMSAIVQCRVCGKQYTL